MRAEVHLDSVAHGGFTVGRIDGKVIFVTGGLPGEDVVVEITQPGKKFDRGQVVEVIQPAPGRVAPSCPVANQCGGCDWQHADGATQRELKRLVVAEQLRRLAGIEWSGRVEEVPGGLTGWRSRVRYASNGKQIGFRARRSHDIVPLPATGCELAMPGPSLEQLHEFAAADDINVTVAAERFTISTKKRRFGPAVVHHQIGKRSYRVAADGFWQVHPEAALILTEAVLAGLAPQLGEVALDLYCGVGLFAGSLVDAGCAVTGFELSQQAVRSARLNVPEATFVAAAMEKATHRLPERVDLVVLDPPRSGAGEKVVKAITACAPRRIAYVSCDPASLARDLATFATQGYAPATIRAFDLFPQTHHVECVAILEK